MKALLEVKSQLSASVKSLEIKLLAPPLPSSPKQTPPPERQDRQRELLTESSASDSVTHVYRVCLFN